MTLSDTDLAELRVLAQRVVGGVLEDADRARELSDDLIDWLVVQDFPIDHVVAHLSAKAVDVSLAALDVGATRRAPQEWTDALGRAPVAGRVATALHVLAGMSLDDAAFWCHRPERQITELINAIGAWRPEPVNPPPPPPAPAPPTFVEPPVAAWTAVDVPLTDPSDVSVDLMALQDPVAPAAALAPTAALPPAAAPVALGDSAGVEPLSRVPVAQRIGRLFSAMTGIVIVGAAIASALALSEPPPRPSFRPTTEASLGPSTEVSKSTESSGCAGPDAQLVSNGELLTVNVTGVDRQYRLFASPPVTPTRPRGLIVAIPDLNQPTELLLAESEVEQLGIEIGSVVVTLIPVSIPGQWNVLGVPDGPADALYASAVVDAVEQRICIDLSRVAVVGKGSGGHFAGTIACGQPSRYSLVAMVAGAFRPSDCTALDDTTVAMVVGGADDIFPITGGLGPGAAALVGDLNLLAPGARYDPPAFDAAVAGWAQDLDCDPSKGQAVFDGPPPNEALTGARLTECRDGTSLITVSVTASGHEWTPAATQIIREQLLARRDR